MAGIPNTWGDGKKQLLLRHVWTYTRNKEVLGLVARYDGPDGKVAIPFFVPNGAGWKPGSAPIPRPLFGLDTLKPGGRCYVVEGEKAAAALHSLGLPAVTSPGGSNGAGKADWTPIEVASEVVILPDNNGPGETYARDICAALKTLQNSPAVFMARLEGLPDGGDVVDWLETHLPDWDGFTPIPEHQVAELREALTVTVKELLEPIPKEWTELDTTDIETPNTLTAAALVDTEFPPIRWVVHGLLPEGLTLLAGSPKVGKSWLCLDLCLSVTRGASVLGADTQQGEALYLALEDTPRRLKRRLLALLNGTPAPTSLHLATEWPQAEDGARKLGAWLAKHPECQLVVVDTLARYRGKPDGKKGLYQQEYDDVRPLLELAGKHGVAVVLVHHTRKQESDDALHLVSGTQGLTGGVDGVWVLKRTRGTGKAQLFITGRDIENEQTFALEWHKKAKRWTVAGTGREALLSLESKKVLDVVRQHGPITGRDVASTLHPGLTIDRDSKEWSRVRKLLAKLGDTGLIVNGEGGYTYVHP